jgi:hypothetical protein
VAITIDRSIIYSENEIFIGASWTHAKRSNTSVGLGNSNIERRAWYLNSLCYFGCEWSRICKDLRSMDRFPSEPVLISGCRQQKDLRSWRRGRRSLRRGCCRRKAADDSIVNSPCVVDDVRGTPSFDAGTANPLIPYQLLSLREAPVSADEKTLFEGLWNKFSSAVFNAYDGYNRP